MPRKTTGISIAVTDGDIASMRPRPDAAENIIDDTLKRLDQLQLQ